VAQSLPCNADAAYQIGKSVDIYISTRESTHATSGSTTNITNFHPMPHPKFGPPEYAITPYVDSRDPNGETYVRLFADFCLNGLILC